MRAHYFVSTCRRPWAGGFPSTAGITCPHRRPRPICRTCTFGDVFLTLRRSPIAARSVLTRAFSPRRTRGPFFCSLGCAGPCYHAPPAAAAGIDCRARFGDRRWPARRFPTAPRSFPLRAMRLAIERAALCPLAVVCGPGRSRRREGSSTSPDGVVRASAAPARSSLDLCRRTDPVRPRARSRSALCALRTSAPVSFRLGVALVPVVAMMFFPPRQFGEFSSVSLPRRCRRRAQRCVRSFGGSPGSLVGVAVAVDSCKLFNYF